MARCIAVSTDFLACDNDGWEWLTTTLLGSVFLLLHMVCICMQAVMIEKVFYSIPHHMGYFKLKKEEHEI